MLSKKIISFCKISGLTLVWFLTQIIVLSMLSSYPIKPSSFFKNAGTFSGPGGIVGGFLAGLALIMVVLVYTAVGSTLIIRYGLISNKFKKEFAKWYLIYVAVISPSYYISAGPWFWEGFGVYLLDYLFVPIMWLIELLIVHYCIQGIKSIFYLLTTKE